MRKTEVNWDGHFFSTNDYKKEEIFLTMKNKFYILLSNVDEDFVTLKESAVMQMD